jgi:hypothetical protein
MQSPPSTARTVRDYHTFLCDLPLCPSIDDRADIGLFPIEEQIAIAVSAYTADIFCLSDVIRVICLLVGLKLIPGDRVKWIPEITRPVTCDSRCFEWYCHECCSRTCGWLIRDTIRDSLSWFLLLDAALGLPPESISDAELRMQRLFVGLLHDAQFRILKFFCNRKQELRH